MFAIEDFGKPEAPGELARTDRLAAALRQEVEDPRGPGDGGGQRVGLRRRCAARRASSSIRAVRLVVRHHLATELPSPSSAALCPVARTA